MTMLRHELLDTSLEKYIYIFKSLGKYFHYFLLFWENAKRLFEY